MSYVVPKFTRPPVGNGEQDKNVNNTPIRLSGLF